MAHFEVKNNHFKSVKGSRVVGFFPGLGSKFEYQGVGDFLLKGGSEEVEKIYREAALAMGYGNQPEKVLITNETLPQGKMERHGFIGATFLLHNVALWAQLRNQAESQNHKLNFVAYAGESLGIVSAAVASGSLNVGDGVKIANFFVPYVFMASGNYTDSFSKYIISYYPSELKEKILIPEPYYVVALRGRGDRLEEVYSGLQEEFFFTEVELHKSYSENQKNFYVKASIKSCFDIFIRNYPGVDVVVLKEPTSFLTHSAQLTALKKGFERFIYDERIVFHDPHTPLVANHCDGLLTSKDAVKTAVFAILDKAMLSSATARGADSFNSDAIVELGLGNKSVQMLRDNNVYTPALSFSGDPSEAQLIIKSLSALESIRYSKDATLACRGIEQWLTVARENNNFANMFSQKIMEAVKKKSNLKLQISGSNPISVDSIYKNSWRYRDQLKSGELILMARLRRNIQGEEHNKNHSFADLQVLTNDGSINYQKTPFITHSEKTLLHFSSLDGLSDAEIFHGLKELESSSSYREMCQHSEIESNNCGTLQDFLQLNTVTVKTEIQVMRRIVFQVFSFELLKKYRPGLFQPGNTCLIARDFIGWLACLVASGSSSLDSVTVLCRDYYSTLGQKNSSWKMVKNFALSLTNAHVPVLSSNGLPQLDCRDLEANTYKMLLGDFPARCMNAALDCHLSVVTFDCYLDRNSLDTSPYLSDIILIRSIKDIWQTNTDLVLEQKDREAQMYLTQEYRQVSDYAKQRNLLCSTVNAYIDADEVPVQFCNGGSESMTMFIRRAPNEPIIVRKILSEALTSAKWYDYGKGVMLPPFAKASRQVDYLRALPVKLKSFFPEVYDVTEREILTPVNQERVGKYTCKEVIYEMSLVEGEEVSQLIKNNCLSPLVIARLYEIIFIFLRDNVHCENRVPANGNTLEVSYFRKIEERLNLCRETAPESFSSKLLDGKKIVINGKEYLNIQALLHAFRSNPDFQRILEPKFHSLVMGDTNTENIKVGNSTPLIEIQDMIEQGRSEADVLRALSLINAEDIQLRFLDPRAIGFQSEGANCRDDYMYDNKPWHNSIGHYDEIHSELFTLDLHFDESKTPVVNIKFSDSNVYNQAYQVVDCAERNVNPTNESSVVGIEKYFAQVMNAVYETSNPNSIFLQEDPHWLVRFVFMMGTHFAAMPPFHFSSELDGTIKDSVSTQRRPLAIYCEGIKWLNWSLEILEGKREQFLGVNVPYLESDMKKAV